MQVVHSIVPSPNEESVPSHPHVVSEHEPLDMQKPLCAICGERTNRRVWQDLDPLSPTYQECSTTCSNTCRSLEHRAIQEADMMARVRILIERREADEISTVSGQSSAGSQNQSSGSHNQSRSSRRWRSNGRRSHHRAGKTSSSSVQHDDDGRGQGVSDGGSSSSSRPSSRRSSRSNQPDAALAQALLQSTTALTVNENLCSCLLYTSPSPRDS